MRWERLQLDTLFRVDHYLYIPGNIEHKLFETERFHAFLEIFSGSEIEWSTDQQMQQGYCGANSLRHPSLFFQIWPK